jgi:transposase
VSVDLERENDPEVLRQAALLLEAENRRLLARVMDLTRVRLIYQPPHSPDLNPIEPGWALQKQYVRKHAPRSHDALRRIARRARYRVTQRHCQGWFAHAGYGRPR